MSHKKTNIIYRLSCQRQLTTKWKLGFITSNLTNQVVGFVMFTCAKILMLHTVLENVRQRQQHRCQEMFDKISSQEIFLHLAGNSFHLIN